MNIRPECPEDIAGVWAVERAAFGRDAEADLADRLRAHGKVRLSMLAEEDGVVLGHVLYSGVRLEGEHGVGMPWGWDRWRWIRPGSGRGSARRWSARAWSG